MAWSIAMSMFGWKVLAFGFFAVIDWAKRRLTDSNVEREALTESFDATDKFMDDCRESGIDPSDCDETLREILSRDTPAQQKWLQQELFAAMSAAPWFMGLAHGLGVGTLLGALLGLIPNDGVSVTSGAIGGCIIGVAIVVSLVALISGLFSPGQCISVRHRLLMIASPLFVVPALLEAALLWSRWFLGRRVRSANSP